MAYNTIEKQRIEEYERNLKLVGTNKSSIDMPTSMNVPGAKRYLPTNSGQEAIAIIRAQNKTNDNTWFKKSKAMEEENSAKSLAKTIASTGYDISGNFLRGVGSIIEGASDTAKYGYAGIQNLLGNKEKANQIRNEASQVNNFENFLGFNEEQTKNSVLGKKSEGIAQGIGYYGGMIALQTVGVPWEATSSLTSFGGSYGEALNEGATSGQAFLFGLGSAAAEIMSEKIFSGINLPRTGKNILNTEKFVETQTDKIKNELVKRLVKFGISSIGEGAEEIISGVATEAAKRLIYSDKWDYSTQDAFDDFISGTIVAGITGGAQNLFLKNGNGKVNIEDQKTNNILTVNELINQKQNQNQNDNANVSIQQQELIEEINKYNQLQKESNLNLQQEQYLEELKAQLNDIQNQNTDNNISLPVRESTSTVQDVVNQEKASQSNINLPVYNQYSNIKNSDKAILPTVNDFNSSNINMPTSDIKVDMAKISPEILNDIKGFKLGDPSIESYKGSYIKTMLNEVGIKVPNAMNYVSEVRPDMSFTTTKDLTRQQYASVSNALQKLRSVDVTSVNNANYSIPIGHYQYVKSSNANINELRRTASMYLNNTARSNNTIRLLENIIKDRNYIIKFNPNITNEQGVPVNGLITKENGKTIIELNPNADNYVEFLVVHEITHDIATKEMKKLILDYAKQDPEFEKSLESLKERYKTNDVSDEVVADVCGELFGNREFIQSVVEKKPNIFKKILNNIRKLAEKIKGTGANEYVSFVEKLKTMWEDAYYSNISNLKEKMFSIQQDSNGNKYVKVDTNQDIFEGKSISEQVKIAKQYILNNFRENGINVNNENIKVTSKTANEYTHPKNQLPTTTKSSKMKASTELDNLLLISNYKYSKPDDGRHPFAKNGWDYYETTFKVGDNLFTGLVNVAKSENKKTLYDITNIKRIDQNRSTSANAFTTSLVNSIANNIPQSDNNVNSGTSFTTKYSIPINKNNTQGLDNSSFSLEQRVSGDKLLDTQDLIEEIKMVGAKVDKNGYVTLYHQTTSENADKIKQSGKMFAKEPYVYFSTSENASQSDGRGNTKLEFKIPAEKLILDDIFDDNADVKIKLDSSKELDVSNYIVKENSDLNKYIFDNDFYDQFKYEDKTKITKTISELKSEKEKLDPDNNEDDWVKNYHLNTKIKALENGYNSEYDYLVGREKERLTKDYEFGKLTKQIEEKKRLEAKNNQLQQDIKESTPFKNAQYKIIQETNPMFDEEHVGIRSPKDIKTFEEVINDEDSFTWGDYSKEDAIRDLKKGTVIIYSSYPIKNGTFVSTSYQQALDYAGGDPTQVHSRKASLNSVAWINGDEGQYAKVYDILPTKYSQSTKEWNDYLKENFPSAGTKTKMSDIKLPVREDIKNDFKKSGVLNSNENISKNFELDYTPQDPTKESTYDEPEKLAEILKEKPNTIEEKDNWLKKLATIKFIDKGYYVDKLARKVKNKELSSKYDYSLLSNGIANQIIGNGRFNDKGNKIGKGLYEIFEPIENSGLLDDFSRYIYHKHNIDRMSLQNRFNEENKAVFGDGMTSEMSEKIVNEYETKYPEFESWADDIYKYNNANLEMLVKYGVLSKDSMEYYNKKYPHYVPTIREQTKTKTQMDFLLGKKASVNNPIKKAKGGNGNIIPLKDAMALRTMQTVNSALRNNFGLELLNSIETEQIRNQENVDNIVEEINSDELLTKSSENSPATLTVFDKGEKVTFEISDEIYEALKPSNIKTFKILNKLNNIRRWLLTEYNPTFMITNPLKDIQDGSINSKHPKLFIKNLPEAIMQIKNNGLYKQLYIANGGSYETYFNYNTGTNIAPSILDKILPLKKISEMNEIIEMAPRLAEFMASIEAGDSIETAMYNASEITTNFKRGGDITKTLDRNGVTFLNAGVQGAVKQVRNVQEARVESIKGITKLAVRWTIAGLTPALLMGMLWGDDDEYEELSDYIKNNYYIIGKYGNGEFIKIPKGRVVSVLQKFFQNLIDGANGKKIDLEGLADLIENNLLPSDPNESSLIAPIKQAINNETWYGGVLVPTRLQNLPNAEQYDETTDSISIWLGKKLNISPYKINYVLDQYAGAIGDYTLPYLTQAAESGNDSFAGKLLAPVKDKFTVDSTLKNQNISDFYSLSEELTKKSNSSSATDEDILKNKYINSVKSEISKLYAKKREIQSSSLKDSEKYNKSKEIQKEINELSKSAIYDYKNVVSYENYGKISDQEYYLNGKSEWIKVKDDEKEEINKLNMSDADKNKYFKTKVKIGVIRGNEEKESNIKHKEIADLVIDSGLNDNFKGYLYGKYYSSEKIIETVLNAKININEYIKFNSETFESDYYTNGKTVPNSRKNKVIKYINSLNLSIPQKAMLIKMEYSSFKQYDNQIVKYVNNIDCSSYDKKVILKTIGFTSYDKDIINAINSKDISIEEKTKELEELGFKVRNGRVYTK